MKIVINDCFGGFSLSPRAIKRLAELNGRECYFFTVRPPSGKVDLDRHYPISLERAEKDHLFFHAFDIPNPDELLKSTKAWHAMSVEERQAQNAIYDAHTLHLRPRDRSDPKLIQVVEELGGGHRTGASGSCASLKIIEIPDGVEYEIEEYDGNESVHEVHRSWS